MSKRGVSHIEIILSFIIFVGAIAFALYFFNPADSNRLVDTSLRYGFREIREFTEVEILTYSVDIDGAAVDQWEIDNDPLVILAVPVQITGVNPAFGIRAKENDGSYLGAYRIGDLVHIQKPGAGWIDVEFISIGFNDEFSYGGGDVGVHDENFYTLSSSTSKKVLSESKFRELDQFYLINYTGLKEDFNIPPRVNLGFSIDFSNDTLSAERKIPEGLEVFSESQRVEIVRIGGDLEFADLTVWVW
jgi:hypothetical protein